MMQQTCDFMQLLTSIGLAGFAIFVAIIAGIITYKIAAEAFRRNRHKRCYSKEVDYEKGDSPNEIIFYRPSDKTFYKTRITQEARNEINQILEEMAPVTFYNV
jgi:hypothetical protein